MNWVFRFDQSNNQHICDYGKIYLNNRTKWYNDLELFGFQ